MNDEQRLKSRFIELSERSDSHGCYTYSEFLTLAQQDLLLRTLRGGYRLFGGFDTAERKIACFGSKESCGYEEAAPLCLIEISPVSQKFADALTHRDFLGALMGLGIRREVLGDILIHNNCGYLICLDTISQYIIDNFKQVRHTTVGCKAVESLPVSAVSLPEESEFVVASERCDSAIAAIYNLSRAESQKLFMQKLVYINSVLVENTSHALSVGDTVSVRGHGRFIYRGIKLETRKGKLRITVQVF